MHCKNTHWYGQKKTHTNIRKQAIKKERKQADKLQECLKLRKQENDETKSKTTTNKPGMPASKLQESLQLQVKEGKHEVETV